MRPNLPLLKMGQRQTKVIIHKNFVVLETKILHTKFQCNQPSGSEKEDVFRSVPYIGMVVFYTRVDRKSLRN